MSIQIVLHETTFEVPLKYSEGHVLTANEANALNFAHAQLVGKNFSSKVKTAKGEEKTLSDAAREDLQNQISAYSKTYEFPIRKTISSLTPLQKMANKLAEEAIKSTLRKHSIDPKSKSEEWWEAKIAEIAAREEILVEANRRIAAASTLIVELEK